MDLVELEDIIQSIIEVDSYKIEKYAKKVFQIETDYMGTLEIMEQLEEKLMQKIENDPKLMQFFKKEAQKDGKFCGKAWNLITNIKNTENVLYFIKNSEKYGRDYLIGEDVIKMLLATKDIEFIDSFLNNDNKIVFVSLDKVELLKRLNNVEYTKKCIKNRKSYQLDMNVITQIIDEQPNLSFEDIIENRNEYNFTSDELTKLISLTHNTEYINNVIKNRKEYNLSIFNLIELLKEMQVLLSLKNEEVVVYYTQHNSENFKFSISEVSKIVTIDKNPDFLKSCINKNYFNTNEKMYMALLTEDDEYIKEFTKCYIKRIEDKEQINLPENMTIGIEIETEGSESRFLRELDKIYGKWNSKYDASLKNGVEIVSPILTPKKSDEIYEICDILNLYGQHPSHSCGGHIHIGADYLTSERSFQILAEGIWEKAEKIIYKISNREGEIPRENIKKFAKMGRPKEEESLEDKRYYGIHFFNVKKEDNKELNNDKNTIEFRISNGTIKPEVWIENINLYGGIVKTAEEIANIEKKAENIRTLGEKQKLKSYIELQNAQTEEEKLGAFLELVIDEDDRYIYRQRYVINSNLIERDKDMSKYIDERE